MSHANSKRNVRQEWDPNLKKGWNMEGNPRHLSRVYFKGYTFRSRRISRRVKGMTKGRFHMSQIIQYLEILSESWKSISAKRNPFLELL